MTGQTLWRISSTNRLTSSALNCLGGGYPAGRVGVAAMGVVASRRKCRRHTLPLRSTRR